MGITAASMATMRPLLRLLLSKDTGPRRPITDNMRWFGSNSRRSGSSPSSQNQSKHSANRGAKWLSKIRPEDSGQISYAQEHELQDVPDIEKALNGLRQHPLNTSKGFDFQAQDQNAWPLAEEKRRSSPHDSVKSGGFGTHVNDGVLVVEENDLLITSSQSRPAWVPLSHGSIVSPGFVSSKKSSSV
jgi:hypothetical protein